MPDDGTVVELPYHCPVCQKRFASKSAATAHTRVSHKISGRYDELMEYERTGVVPPWRTKAKGVVEVMPSENKKGEELTSSLKGLEKTIEELKEMVAPSKQAPVEPPAPAPAPRAPEPAPDLSAIGDRVRSLMEPFAAKMNETNDRICTGLECIQRGISEVAKQLEAEKTEPSDEPAEGPKTSDSHDHDNVNHPIERISTSAALDRMMECKHCSRIVRRKIMSNFSRFFPGLVLRSRDELDEEREEPEQDNGEGIQESGATGQEGTGKTAEAEADDGTGSSGDGDENGTVTTDGTDTAAPVDSGSGSGSCDPGDESCIHSFRKYARKS